MTISLMMLKNWLDHVFVPSGTAKVWREVVASSTVFHIDFTAKVDSEEELGR